MFTTQGSQFHPKVDSEDGLKWQEDHDDASPDGESSDSTLSPGEVSDLSMIEDQTFKAIRRGPSSSSQEKIIRSTAAVPFGITRSEISFSKGKESFHLLGERELIGHDHNQNLIHMPKQSQTTAIEHSTSLSKMRCDFDNKRVDEPFQSFSSDDRFKLTLEGKPDIQRLQSPQGNGGFLESFPESYVKTSSVLPKISTEQTGGTETKLPFSSFRQPGFHHPNRVPLYSSSPHIANENVGLGRRKEKTYVFSSLPQTVPRLHVAETTRKRAYDSRSPSNCSSNQNGSSRNSKSEDSVNTNRLSNSKDHDTTVSVSESYTCWRKPLIDQIFITDVTANFVTVTVKECCTDKGFFRRR